MPFYEYACKACAHEFEREQRISEKPVRKCPKCGRAKARRLISRTSFVLKGGGWYNDLYASNKAAGAKKEDAKTEAKGDAGEKKSGGDGKTEGDGKKSGKGKSGIKAA